MNYEIKLSDSGKYVIVIVNCDMTRALGEQVGIEAIQLAQENNTKLFLYDLRNSTNRESVHSNYIFATQDVNRIKPSFLNKIALLTRPNDKSHNFVETVLRNAGHDVLIFKDDQKAIDWLLDAI